jgi:hypothetical protein
MVGALKIAFRKQRYEEFRRLESAKDVFPSLVVFRHPCLVAEDSDFPATVNART